MGKVRVLSALVVLLILASSVYAQTGIQTSGKLDAIRAIVTPVQWHWRYVVRDVPGAQDPTFDDSKWKTADGSALTWSEHDDPVVWLRTTIVVPDTICGIAIKGSRLTLKCGMDDDGIIYVNGKEAQKFHWDQGSAVISQGVVPGEKYAIAIKGINTGGPGRLLSCDLEYSALDDLRVNAQSLLNGWQFASDACAAVGSDAASAYSPRLDQAWAAIDTSNQTKLIETMKAQDAEFRTIGNELTSHLTTSLVGHAHIDLEYMWTWDETLKVIKNTFGTLSGLMDEYPFVFSQSQAALYDATKQHYPDIYAKIKERVKRGQWDVSTATAWSEGDTNMSSGEAIVRSLLLANRYIKSEFGIEPNVGWLPDNFGHTAMLPQIYARSGIKYFCFMRGGIDKPAFWWYAPDGSKILAYNYRGYNGDANEGAILGETMDFAKRTGFANHMKPYGVGDHGGGPTRQMLQDATRLQSRESYPKVKFISVVGYMDALAASNAKLPSFTGELNPVFVGCYTAHADAKQYNRECENTLATAEVFCSIAEGFGSQYPADDFTSSWRKTCFNEFHDILCGSAIHAGYDYAKQLHDEAVTQANGALDNALATVARRIDTRGQGIPVVVFNPLAWTRTDAVSVASPFPAESTQVVVADSAGKVFAARTLGNRLCFTARDIPAMGYKVFWVRKTTEPVKSGVWAKGSIAENQFFRVSIDSKLGVINGIYDKINHRNVMASNRKSDLLQILSEDAGGANAWGVGRIQKTEDLLDSSEVVALDTGPAKVTMQFDHKYDNSIFTEQLTLYDDVPRIDIKLTADWQQPWAQGPSCPMLKAAFTPQLKDPKATFEIPFGSMERPRDGKEVVAQKWIDLSDSSYGVSLLNDCKYGFDVTGDTMRISLLRSSHHPDPNPDQGMHEMTYSLYPHKGDWREAGTVRRGYELNEPLLTGIEGNHAGSLAASKSFVSVSSPDLVVTALKQAYDDSSLIVRCYESSGKPCEATLHIGLRAKSYQETDLMERPIGSKLPIVGGDIPIKVGKYEIKTYKLLSE